VHGQGYGPSLTSGLVEPIVRCERSDLQIIDASTGLPRHIRVNLAAQSLNEGAPKNGAPQKLGQRVGTLMTTFQAVMLGVMLTLTPSLVLLALLIWREGIGAVEQDGSSVVRSPHN
jgi:hypothetical protein